ncbi:hypothetical protein QYE76_052683 [Lolium multiflorum]|uniref:Uncharacterized protein n=1 Tax=Lolium multiflorum TaxID=4521 RepID=A0AAD8WJE1_LOLMU|nr:hypothetical protein QYE76_052683 [Lolium multiflorum]
MEEEEAEAEETEVEDDDDDEFDWSDDDGPHPDETADQQRALVKSFESEKKLQDDARAREEAHIRRAIELSLQRRSRGRRRTRGGSDTVWPPPLARRGGARRRSCGRQKEALWLDPQYNDGSAYWPVRFLEEQEAALNHFVGEHLAPEKNNVERIAYWSRPIHTVKMVIDDPYQVAIVQEATVVGIVNLDSNDET